MAPDVDGQVLINEGSATVGEIVPVRITEAHPYDLVGGIEKTGIKLLPGELPA
jgi:ribosomal protein S12 methylthiotransferase